MDKVLCLIENGPWAIHILKILNTNRKKEEIPWKCCFVKKKDNTTNSQLINLARLKCCVNVIFLTNNMTSSILNGF